MKLKSYYLGLDIGTDSVGYAVTDEQYQLIKFHGEPAWGATVFDEASLNGERRSFRTARRRLDRRQQRVKLIQELFSPEVEKVDPRFFIRQQESYLYRDEVNDKHILFNDVDYTDIDFGLECDFSFVVENQSARTLYTIGIHAVLLDDENTILGTEDAYVDATIKNGQKATANGFFYLDDYDGVKSIVADCAYYGVNDAYTVSELALDEDQISKTKLVLDDTAAELTDAEIAYNSMKNLDVSDLTETSTGKYKYNGISNRFDY